MTDLFCIVGKQGAGKTTYLEKILKIDQLQQEVQLKQLIYSTTRDRRINEKDGVDYYFRTKEYFEKALAKDKIIEFRKYADDLYYFTERESIEDNTRYIIAASIEQVANYIHCLENANIYIIYIDCSLETRFDRIYHSDRISSDKDILELCRRTLQEIDDYSDKNIWDTINQIHEKDHLIVNNDPGIVLQANAMFIYEWIWQKTL